MKAQDAMHSGVIYHPQDPAIAQKQLDALDMLFEYNSLRPSQQAEKQALMKKMFAEVGEGTYIETPFHANWAGKFVHLGKYVYCNFNVTFVDDTHIYVGDYTLFGPNCVVATACHPLNPEIRERDFQYNLPVHIGRNCWFGAGVIILPGVTVGDNAVIGAGSVVTKDIPSDVIAVGNPCRVIRKINDDDMNLIVHGKQLEIIENLE